MTIIKNIKKHINQRYNIDYSKLMNCLDDELIRLEDRSRDRWDTFYYIESNWYIEGCFLSEDIYNILYEENGDATHDNLCTWSEDLVESISPDELIEYLGKRHTEIEIRRAKKEIEYHTRRLKEIMDN